MPPTNRQRERKQPQRAVPPHNPESARIVLRSPGEYDGLALRLLHVARANFVKHGYYRASVAAIAAEAGTSVGLVYYHFGSKEGLYRAIWTDYQRRQWQHAHQAIVLVKSAGVTDGRMLFLTGARAYLANCWEGRDLIKMVVTGDVPPGFSSESREANDDWLRMNTRLLQMPDDPDGLYTKALVRMAANAIGGACQLISECGTAAEAEQSVEVAMEIFSRMIASATGAPPEAFSRPPTVDV